MTYSQENIEQLFRLTGSFPDQEYVQTTHFDYIRTTNSIWPNQLFNLKTSESEIEAVLNEIENDAENGKIPNLLMLNPGSANSLPIEKIKQRDYKSSTWFAMTHNLEFIVTQDRNTGFRVKQVKNKNDFRAWLSIVEEELMGNNSLNPDVFIKFLENNSCYFFLGFEKNLPVATSFLFVNAKGAGVYLVSTKKLNRRKGYGLAMTNQCLLKARELECEQVDLQATQLGKGVYESLGFIEQGAIDVFRIKKNQP